MRQQGISPQVLMEKWSPIIDHPDMPKIEDPYRRQCTAILLENQEEALAQERVELMEDAPANVTGNVAKYDPVLIGLVRRAMPLLIAYDLCGVQPMALPTGLVFALKSRYGDQTTIPAGTEALFHEANTIFSGQGSGYAGQGQSGTSPVDATNGLSPWATVDNFTNGGGQGGASGYYGQSGFVGANTGASILGSGMDTSTGEGVVPQEMGFTIDKYTVTAKTRALKADYSIELAQDLKAVHGLDAESELSNILSREILAEINREVIRTMYFIAQPGAQYGTTTPGIFDLDVDANGRWSVERFKGLIFQLERDANRIAQLTRRGKANFILCSADVASALAMTGLLSYTPAIQANLNVDDSSTTFAGVLNGKYKVYVDPYMANGSTSQYYMAGYKGTSPYDAGLFYCPYVPLQMLRAVDPMTFQPKIGFKTRYGMIGNPLAGLDADSASNIALQQGKNAYYSLVGINNLT